MKDLLSNPVRIASLVPSATELLCALGLRPWLVARTGFCIHPREQVADLPKVGGTKDVNLPRLLALQPSHVVLNVDENLRELADSLREQAPQAELIVTHPCGPEDVPALIRQLSAPFAALPGVAARAAALQADLSQALVETPSTATRSVLYLIWRQPWMTVARDTYIARLLAHAGWRPEPAVEGGASGAARYPELAADAPLWRQVDEVWLSSEPYRFGEAHLAEVQTLAPQARVRLVDGELCSWWGARTAAGLRYLRALQGA
ncbi:helical backbone metal receptor [Inhella proteolytica]|uniref:ABC transporter substrate-binding protein n=1 Tax=Inhella proteolytica TaxID=2795029 RepID=A0A931J0P3_9BURK|nr:helical backbone metal receptor [Inhella proteolytica]MBH9577344.1 ABC transporter substrate-binding protein [Inhella proteolytica]